MMTDEDVRKRCEEIIRAWGASDHTIDPQVHFYRAAYADGQREGGWTKGRYGRSFAHCLPMGRLFNRTIKQRNILYTKCIQRDLTRRARARVDEFLATVRQQAKEVRDES